MMRVLFAAIAIAILASCNPEVDATFHSQIVVQGFLYANEPLDSIVIRRTLPIDTKSPTDRVNGATVRISTDDTTIQLSGTTSGCYVASSPFIIQPGKTYQLLVAWNGDTARATTTVPQAIHIDSAKLGDVPLADTIEFNTHLSASLIHLWWSASPGSAGYGLEALSLDTARSDTIIFTGEATPADSIAWGRYRFFILSTEEQIVWQQFKYFGPNVLRALALDQNYQDFILGLFLSGSQYNNGTLHVSEGLGVFASAARASRFVYLK